MKKSIFLSYPRPFNADQENFIKDLSAYLSTRGMEPRTLGVTDYDVDALLKAIRRLMLESNGLITVAFRRTLVHSAEAKPGTAEAFAIQDKWLTSPYAHIEPAMAFQIGLPILILRESGVIADGILEKGVVGTYMPEFDLSKASASYLQSPELSQIIGKWEGYVASVIESRGNPPKLY